MEHQIDTVAQSFSESDDKIIDVVLATLFQSKDMPAMRFEEEILAANHITLSPGETERMWHMLVSSEWVSPVAGFGEAGKLTLTHTAIQMLLVHGSYLKYLETLHKPVQKTVIHHIGPSRPTISSHCSR